MVHSISRLSWLSIAWFGTVAGCASGQTGSPECAGASSCICDAVHSERSPVLLRGRVTSVGSPTTDPRSSVTVEHLVDPGYAWDIVVGDVVGGVQSSGPDCAPNGYRPALGDEVFAIYTRGDADQYPSCIEYLDCSSQNCGPQPSSVDSSWDSCDGQCISDTFEACLLHRSDALANGALWLSRWGEVIELGEGYQVAAADLQFLVHTELCYALFPPPPTPPCNDVVTSTGCTTVALGPSSSSLVGWLAGVAALCVGVVRWRRRPRQSPAADTKPR